MKTIEQVRNFEIKVGSGFTTISFNGTVAAACKEAASWAASRNERIVISQDGQKIAERVCGKWA